VIDAAPGRSAGRGIRARPAGRRAEPVGYLFVLPAMAGILVFGAVPLVYAFVASLRADTAGGASPFAGGSNYAALVADPVFWTALRNTALYALMLVPLQTAAGLGLALAVAPAVRGIALLRTAYFLPVVISYVVAAGLWEVLFATPSGPVNSLLALVHAPPQGFFQDPAQALPLMALMSTWKWSGISMLIFLSGLNEIPKDMYEASGVDGAGAVRQFGSITWPLLQRITLFVLVVNTIEALKIFTPVYVITKGGPLNATMVLVYHLFREAFRYIHIGYAAALSCVLLVLILALAGVQFRLLREPAQA
jgi:multiple sugar transport system permease protein